MNVGESQRSRWSGLAPYWIHTCISWDRGRLRLQSTFLAAYLSSALVATHPPTYPDLNFLRQDFLVELHPKTLSVPGKRMVAMAREELSSLEVYSLLSF